MTAPSSSRRREHKRGCCVISIRPAALCRLPARQQSHLDLIKAAALEVSERGAHEIWMEKCPVLPGPQQQLASCACTWPRTIPWAGAPGAGAQPGQGCSFRSITPCSPAVGARTDLGWEMRNYPLRVPQQPSPPSAVL